MFGKLYEIVDGVKDCINREREVVGHVVKVKISCLDLLGSYLPIGGK